MSRESYRDHSPGTGGGRLFRVNPSTSGLHTQGEALEEVRANLREAAEAWLVVAHEDGMTRDAAKPQS